MSRASWHQGFSLQLVWGKPARPQKSSDLIWSCTKLLYLKLGRVFLFSIDDQMIWYAMHFYNKIIPMHFCGQIISNAFYAFLWPNHFKCISLVKSFHIHFMHFFSQIISNASYTFPWPNYFQCILCISLAKSFQMYFFGQIISYTFYAFL